MAEPGPHPGVLQHVPQQVGADERRGERHEVARPVPPEVGVGPAGGALGEGVLRQVGGEGQVTPKVMLCEKGSSLLLAAALMFSAPASRMGQHQDPTSAGTETASESSEAQKLLSCTRLPASPSSSSEPSLAPPRSGSSSAVPGRARGKVTAQEPSGQSSCEGGGR